MNELKSKGIFKIKHFRDGVLLDEWEQPNDVTLEGKNAMLDNMFNAGTQSSNWYVGLINNAGFTAVAESDVYTSHAGWTELTNFSQTTRQLWNKGAAASKTVTSSTTSVFTINATCAVIGIFLANSNVKGQTSGSFILWATTVFGAVRNFVSGDTLAITYTSALL